MYNPLETLHVGDQERERVSGTGGGGGTLGVYRSESLSMGGPWIKKTLFWGAPIFILL